MKENQGRPVTQPDIISVTLTYTRIYADDNGESHFEQRDMALQAAAFAPPAPPLDVSAFLPASQVGLIRMPAGWYGDWHPAPRAQFMVCLQGQGECQFSDGTTWRFGAGAIVLVEDTTGKGHTTRVVGDQDILMGVAQLPGGHGQ